MEILEYQPTLFDTQATMFMRVEIESLKTSNDKLRKAMFSQANGMKKDIDVLNGVVSDLVEAYVELQTRLQGKQ